MQSAIASDLGQGEMVQESPLRFRQNRPAENRQLRGPSERKRKRYEALKKEFESDA
jgi:hypothetical protein